jgi:hypothetical protein
MPTEPIEWELEKIWPSACKPGVVISVGCGYKNDPVPDLEPKIRSIWHDGWFFRLIRSMLSSRSLHAQNSWEAFMNGKDRASRLNYFRLNWETQDTEREPELDDATQITPLRRKGQNSSISLDDCRTALWASRFFWEFDFEPEYNHGTWSCRGRILCQSRTPLHLLANILAVYPEAAFVLNKERVLAKLDQRDVTTSTWSHKRPPRNT